MSKEQRKVYKLGELYSYKPLKKYEGLRGDIEVRAPTTYVGIEVELEQVKHKFKFLPTSFHRHEDGSLKINGAEFVTVPIRVCYLENELKRLFSGLNPPLISSRCSVHTHLNVRDMTQEELYKFILLYLVFERSFFNYSGGRQHNIFCTPLYSSPTKLKKTMYRLKVGQIQLVQWSKYFALNLCPIWGNEEEGSKRMGTVEFRHMAGTTNIEKIIEWINLIVSLKISAKKFDTEELLKHLSVMNTTSAYYWLAEQTFKDWHELVTLQPTFKKDVESGITFAKTCTSTMTPLPAGKEQTFKYKEL